MGSDIRIGIAGLNWGKIHLDAFSAIDGATVTAIADSDSERMNQISDTLEGVASYESADELIQFGEIDAVVIATPSYQHERQVGSAFDRGLHVLCETPVGIRGSEASHIVTSAGLVGKVFMCSNPLRFDPRISEAKKLIESGELGEVFRASSHCHRAQWPHPSDSWKLDRERGGGALLECGLDVLDAIWFALGNPDPMEAMAGRYELFAKEHAGATLDVPAEDSLSGITRFKDYSILQHSSQIQEATLEESEEVEMKVWGSKGVLDLVSGKIKSGGTLSSYAKAANAADSAILQATAFVEAIAEGSEPINGGKNALALMKMLDALANSAKEKRAESIKVERSLDDLFGGL